MNTHLGTASARLKIKAQTIEDLSAAMEAAGNEYRAASADALDQSILMGRIAAKAKKLLKHSEFTPWATKYSGQSVQWVRKCIRAAEAYAYILDRNDAEELLKRVTSVERLAALSRRLRDGDPDPLADYVPGIIGRPVGAAMDGNLRKLYDQIGDLHRLIKHGASHATAWKQLQYIAKHAPQPKD